MNNRTQCTKKVHVILLLLAISSKVHSFPVTSDNKLYNYNTVSSATRTFRQRTSSIHHHHHGHNLRLPSLHDRSIGPCRSLDDSHRMMALQPFDHGMSFQNKDSNYRYDQGSTGEAARPMGTNKRLFYQSLQQPYALNEASEKCSYLLNKMIAEKILCFDLKRNPLTRKQKDDDDAGEQMMMMMGTTLSLDNPGLNTTFSRVAPGTWTVIYAPHIANGAKFFGGKFEVQYNLYNDGSITSHARYEFPIVGSGYLSVSGTYGSKDHMVCRVDFDRAWITPTVGDNDDVSRLKKPFESLEDVPDSIWKRIINTIGKVMFIEQFAVFPISFLDEDTIVFDFELLGTRICARKVMQ